MRLPQQIVQASSALLLLACIFAVSNSHDLVLTSFANKQLCKLAELA